MTYIDKSKPFEEFDNYVSESKPQNWDRCSPSKRKKLAQHLHNEQGSLCAYCQDDLPLPKGGNKAEIDISHIDHIMQKAKPKYKHLEFDQTNLVISCKGYAYKTTPPPFQLTERGRIKKTDEKGMKRAFCGFYKDHHPTMEFDDQQFLCPTKVKDIETYFRFDIEGNMLCIETKSKADQDKAKYTIDILHLNHDYLVEQRQQEYELLLDLSEEDLQESLSDDFPLTRFFAMAKFLFL